MHYSAILVVVNPAEIAHSETLLERVSGVEVHHRDPGSGSLIAVIEAETAAAQQHTLRRIQALPDVKLAELVCHYLDQSSEDSQADVEGVFS